MQTQQHERTLMQPSRVQPRDAKTKTLNRNVRNTPPSAVSRKRKLKLSNKVIFTNFGYFSQYEILILLEYAVDSEWNDVIDSVVSCLVAELHVLFICRNWGKNPFTKYGNFDVEVLKCLFHYPSITCMHARTCTHLWVISVNDIQPHLIRITNVKQSRLTCWRSYKSTHRSPCTALFHPVSSYVANMNTQH